MATGVAPSAARNLLVWRVGARTFRPFRSARVLTGLPHVEHAVAVHVKARWLDVLELGRVAFFWT
jgi:hypothetical protein